MAGLRYLEPANFLIAKGFTMSNNSTVTLENLLPYDNQDVVIKRTEQFKTKTRTELLVLLATQHQYYVKNVDTGHITILAADPKVMFSSSISVAWKDKHTKNVMRSLARFIPNSHTATIDHPIHARWLRGIEMSAYASNGKIKEGYKAVLNTVSHLINLDVTYDLMNKNPDQYKDIHYNIHCLIDGGFENIDRLQGQYIPTMKPIADLENGEHVIGKYGVITAWALTGGNVMFTSCHDEMRAMREIPRIALYARHDMFSWILEHQDLIDDLTDTYLRILAGDNVDQPNVCGWRIQTCRQHHDSELETLFDQPSLIKNIGTSIIDSSNTARTRDTVMHNCAHHASYEANQYNNNAFGLTNYFYWRGVEHIVGNTDTFHDMLYTNAHIDPFVVSYINAQLFDIKQLIKFIDTPDNNVFIKRCRWMKQALTEHRFTMPRAWDILKAASLMLMHNSHALHSAHTNANPLSNTAIKHDTDGTATLFDTMNDIVAMWKTLDENNIGYEPYPKHVYTVHDLLADTVTYVRQHQFDDALAKHAETHRYLTQSIQQDGYCYKGFIPDTSKWLQDEGLHMHNCIARYTEDVAEGMSIIVSLRRTEIQPDIGLPNNDAFERWVDIELDPNDLSIRQQYLNGNVTLAEHEREIVNRWLIAAKAARA